MTSSELQPFDTLYTTDISTILSPYKTSLFHEQRRFAELWKIWYVLMIVLTTVGYAGFFRLVDNQVFELALQDDYDRLVQEAAKFPPARVGFHPDFDYLYDIPESSLYVRLQETFAGIEEYQAFFEGQEFVINVFTRINQAENPIEWQKSQQRLSLVLEWARQHNIQVMVSFGMTSWAPNHHPFEERFEHRTLNSAETWLVWLSEYSDVISDIRPFYEANSPQGIAYGNQQSLQVDTDISHRYQYLFAEVAKLVEKYLRDTNNHAGTAGFGHGYDAYSGKDAKFLSVDVYNNYEYDDPLEITLYNLVLGKRFAYEVADNWLAFFRDRKRQALAEGEEVECGIGEIGRKYSNAETQFWLKYVIASYLAEGCSIILIFDIDKPDEWLWGFPVEDIAVVASVPRDINTVRLQLFQTSLDAQ